MIVWLLAGPAEAATLEQAWTAAESSSREAAIAAAQREHPQGVRP